MDEEGLALFEYSRRGKLEEVKEELASGVPPNSYFSYDGTTALLVAARGGHGPVVQALVEAGADMDVRTEDGSDALLHAASGGSAEVVSILLAAKANIETVNEDEVTPLILASHYGYTQVVKALLDAGADPNYSAPGWGTALDSAKSGCKELLLSRGARSNVPMKAAAAPKAGEHFSYDCLDSDNAEAALQQYSGQQQDRNSSQLPLPAEVPAATASSKRRLEQIARTVGELQDAKRATPAATARFLQRKAMGLPPKRLGRSGLQVSPVGFGCHRLEDSPEHRNALELAIRCGVNLIDVAPNYSDGAAERAVGSLLKTLFDSAVVARNELVVCTKVGNIVGSALQAGCLREIGGVAHVRDDVWHCIEPAWIQRELTGSLERLGLECVDVLLLHCPEFATKAAGVTMDEVYRRIQRACLHLEEEVRQGRIARYGITAAFYPLRPGDPEHLVLEKVLKVLPEGHHFEVIQFPLNFAEPQPLSVGHTERRPDGAAVEREKGLEAPSLVEMAKAHDIGMLVNRPLDGLYKEMRGVLRFSSDAPVNSEMQAEDLEAMESKLTSLCKGAVGDPEDPITEELAAKTVKCLACLDEVDCVLVGMRQASYVAGIVRLLNSTPSLSPEVAREAVKGMYNTVEMWFCTATSEADHGTAKDWRLPSAAP
mmetsp:Transcript_19676/g.34897  ORF Transcript_19676/g.34897 Transcript_19676/m.34897 type:complete len:657 (-) Transcript_19676:158-2128(-)